MDFLDSIDIDSVKCKSKRVRSWYLYEQVKSLENKQSASISKLADRNYQDKILKKELAERKTRRKIYEHTDETESLISSSLANEDSENISKENLYESLCSFEDEENKYRGSDHEFTFEKNEQSNTYLSEEIPTIQYIKDHSIYSPDNTQLVCKQELPVEAKCIEDDKESDKSVESVIAVDAEKELVDQAENESHGRCTSPAPKHHVIEAPTLNEQYNNTQSLNQYAHEKVNLICNNPAKEVGITSDTRMSDCITASEQYLLKRLNCKLEKEKQNYVCNLWSRVVSFAYQLITTNHGISCDDYSAKIMTAVLACEVMRRGINKMCDMLQPYVSPIKFSSENDLEILKESDREKRKPKKRMKYRKKYVRCKGRQTSRRNLLYDTKWSRAVEPMRPYEFSLNCLESRRRSAQWSNEPWAQMPEELQCGGPITSSNSSLWPHELSRRHHLKQDLYHRKVENPMLKLVTYVDELLMLDEEEG